jgi:hypothetical protein
MPGIVIRLLPLRAATAHRLLPALMLMTGVTCWYLPTGFDCAIASVIPASWLVGVMNIKVVPDEPADWSPLTSRLTRLAGKVGSTAVTVRLPWRSAGTPQQADAEVTEFVAKDADYVLRDDTATALAREAGDDDPGELEPPAQQTQVRRFVPSLID